MATAALSGVRVTFRGGPMDGRVSMVEHAPDTLTIRHRDGYRHVVILYVYARAEVADGVAVYDYVGMTA
jgi:hypothetical protein